MTLHYTIRLAIQARVEMMHKARRIARNLGMRAGAGYLRNRGWSLEGALAVLIYSTRSN